ncbi:MAG: glycosyltransferase [Verrucomicrobiia bacterium]|jgi:glycosyltransferase involved in cell wall biosynthesis
MRVAHIITRLIVGGAQENTVASTLGMHERHDVDAYLISGPTSGPEGSLESQFDAHPDRLTVIPELVRPVRPLVDWGALRRLARLLRENPPDIVHTHSGKAGILGRMAARRAGIRTIVHTIHGPSFGAFQGAAANFAFRAAERHAGRFTTHFVTVANAMRDQYLAAGIGVPEKYTRIFSGFNLKPFLDAGDDPRLREQLGLNKDDFVIGKIARLFELKGHDDLLAVAPELVRANPRIKFLFVGDGEWRSKFERKIDELGIRSHVVFAGLVPPADVPRYVGVMNALAHLSRREGLPRALPQAMAASKPVVAFDCDGAGEVCVDGETGILLRSGDLAGLTKNLVELASDPARCDSLGSAGQSFVRKRFSVERMVDELHKLYLDLLRA